MKKQDKPTAVIGAGGHARVLLDVLFACRTNVSVMIEKGKIQEERIFGVPVIDEDIFFARYLAHEIMVVNGIGSIGSMQARETIYARFLGYGYTFASVIHPTAIISPYTKLGEGVQVMAGAVLQPGCIIGDNTLINTRASIDHDCCIGAHVHIAPGAVLSGNVTIGENTHVGTGAVIIQGITVGKRVIVGAGAVVTRDVPDDTLVRGVPAKAVPPKNYI